MLFLSIDTSCALIIKVECFAFLNTFFEMMVGPFFRMSLGAVRQSATTFLVVNAAVFYAWAWQLFATLTSFCNYDWQWVCLVVQVSVTRRRLLLFWMLKTFSLLFFLLLLNIDKASIVPFVVRRLSVLITKVVDVLGLDGQQNVLVGEITHAVGSSNEWLWLRFAKSSTAEKSSRVNNILGLALMWRVKRSMTITECRQYLWQCTKAHLIMIISPFTSYLYDVLLIDLFGSSPGWRYQSTVLISQTHLLRLSFLQCLRQHPARSHEALLRIMLEIISTSV